jgi:hypothetical protein
MMKNKKTLYLLVLLFVTLVALWGLPEPVRTLSTSRTRYPFVYFSSVEKKLMFRSADERDNVSFRDDEGRAFSKREYDLSLPLLNYRQLTVNGEMPDSIDGVAIDPRLLRTRQVNFRYSPSEKNAPRMGLYIMYESQPKDAKLESPGDVFRMKDGIEFIDARTNTTNAEKSERFAASLVRAGFVFPAQWTYGNLNIRKPYDEGYFSLDAHGALFHVKMVNGRPFVRNMNMDASIEPVYFSPVEPADKRFYGFLFDRGGKVYIVEENGGKYKPLRLDIGDFDPDRDELTVLGNFLYWTVSVQNAAGKRFYALDTETLSRVREASVPAPANRWDATAARLFPVYLSFKDRHSEYLAPRLHFTRCSALVANLAAALLMLLVPRRTRGKRIFDSLYTLLFGIAGAVALLVVPYGKR